MPHVSAGIRRLQDLLHHVSFDPAADVVVSEDAAGVRIGRDDRFLQRRHPGHVGAPGCEERRPVEAGVDRRGQVTEEQRGVVARQRSRPAGVEAGGDGAAHDLGEVAGVARHPDPIRVGSRHLGDHTGVVTSRDDRSFAVVDDFDAELVGGVFGAERRVLPILTGERHDCQRPTGRRHVVHPADHVHALEAVVGTLQQGVRVVRPARVPGERHGEHVVFRQALGDRRGVR